MLFTLPGCEQEVMLDLNEGESRIVIEGWVNDRPGPYEFMVRRSGPFFGEAEEIPVPNATLVLKDDMGGIDTLNEMWPGHYFSTHLQGQQEHEYTL